MTVSCTTWPATTRRGCGPWKECHIHAVAVIHKDSKLGIVRSAPYTIIGVEAKQIQPETWAVRPRSSYLAIKAMKPGSRWPSIRVTFRYTCYALWLAQVSLRIQLLALDLNEWVKKNRFKASVFQLVEWDKNQGLGFATPAAPSRTVQELANM